MPSYQVGFCLESFRNIAALEFLNSKVNKVEWENANKTRMGLYPACILLIIKNILRKYLQSKTNLVSLANNNSCKVYNRFYLNFLFGTTIFAQHFIFISGVCFKMYTFTITDKNVGTHRNIKVNNIHVLKQNLMQNFER